MPSFDVVSEVDMHELANAVDQATRELSTRYDFRGIEAGYEEKNAAIFMVAEADYQLRQMLDILQMKLTKRGIDIKCLEVKDYYPSGKQVKQEVIVRQGLDKDESRKIVKKVKESKIKVQAAVQGEKVRVTGKKRDELQTVMALLKDSDISMPLQFDNLKD